MSLAHRPLSEAEMRMGRVPCTRLKQRRSPHRGLAPPNPIEFLAGGKLRRRLAAVGQRQAVLCPALQQRPSAASPHSPSGGRVTGQSPAAPTPHHCGGNVLRVEHHSPRERRQRMRWISSRERSERASSPGGPTRSAHHHRRGKAVAGTDPAARIRCSATAPSSSRRTAALRAARCQHKLRGPAASSRGSMGITPPPDTNWWPEVWLPGPG